MTSLHFALILLLVALAAAMPPGAAAADDADLRARRFIDRHEATVKPLEIEVGRRWWDANVSGKDEDYRLKEEAENKLDGRLSDPKAFAELKALRGKVGDRLLARQIEVLYLDYLEKQLDPALLKQLTARSNAVEKRFSVFRTMVGGKELTDNQVRQLLRESKDSARRRAVWEASKEVGAAVAGDLAGLVKLRNEAARRLGYSDYHVMQLALAEQSQEQVLALFDELDALTRQPFQAAKAEIDAVLAGQYGIPVAELRPWHYHDPFFQEAPAVFGGDLDAVFRDVDILRVCRQFYASIGLPVDDVLNRSDLYEKPGKNPHAFCTDIDRAGDVRVLANIVPNREWLSTMIHELGHAVYSSKNIPADVPYVLRSDAHPLATEGVAMMYERFVDNAQWLQALGVRVPDPRRFNQAAFQLRRNRLLVFSRWCQVMFRFEKELYGRPDQDLNRAWWDLVERYQALKRPEGRNAPDYAAKIHVVLAPAYYHNYLMGEMFASQVHHAIVREVLPGAEPARAIYVGNPAAGEFMKRRVFGPARTLPWNELARQATGRPLGAADFAKDLEY